MRFPDRYNRQQLLPQIGTEGQATLAGRRVLLLGCGALGCVIADQLARAGVGFLRIVDRDIVEPSNLQRQMLFSEADVANLIPKAHAAAQRLAEVNSDITIEPIVVDVHARNIQSLVSGIDLILDGSDNVALRYLVNDAAVKNNLPWVYGGCVGVEGRVMAIVPGQTPCLRCVFPSPPGAGELPTCDTAGVLGPAVAMVASMQVVLGVQLLLQKPFESKLTTLDAWNGRIRSIDTAGSRDANCICCGKRRFEFLDSSADGSGVVLCGRNAMQMKLGTIDLDQIETRLKGVTDVVRNRFLLRIEIDKGRSKQITLFPDGRAIVGGAKDAGEAKSLLSRYVGI